MLLKLFALACWIEFVTASRESKLLAYRIDVDEDDEEEEDPKKNNWKKVNYRKSHFLFLGIIQSDILRSLRLSHCVIPRMEQFKKARPFEI